MVGEFPELQGIMGGYYARAQGESDAVADAIRDHYKPVGQGDDVPTAPVTVALSLADKLDTLVQFFAAGMPPTGSKDPFALRRAAIGFLSLLLQNDLRCSLKRMLVATGAGASFAILEEFLIDRLKVQQREAGVRHDLIDAVFSLGGEDDLVRLLARVKALQAYVSTAEGTNLLAAYKRAANILKGSDPVSPALDTARDVLMADPADIALLSALDIAEPQAKKALEAEQFEDAMAALATLRAPIDRFFEEVMVNDEDAAKRAFRLGLLARFRDAVTQVADFSKIEG
jgi:glycyl-tRNA synthetase beta chain